MDKNTERSAQLDSTDQLSIRGRLALITGASGGIGGACARDFANKGVNLALTYSTNRPGIESLVAELKSSAPNLQISIHQADLASVDAIKTLLVEVKDAHPQPVDILVANAGYGKRIRDISDISLEEFEHTFQVNLRAPFLLAKGVVDDMKAQRWGRIIFVSSIAASGAGINGCHYAASKGGLTGMMKNLASRLAQYNISVNDVAPAMIGSTGMIPDAKAVPEALEGIPLGRLGMPEEVANVITLFASTGFITGQSLLAAGGLR